ncbi:MAG: glycosyltransferase family 4 protein, partial [Flavobacteriaceae bacterium]|nr:glycosyltransferase family 4 protein [Flavobacteriaceae bacterium]
MKRNEEHIKICFLADKHHLYDDRIYWKMAAPLVKKGYRVHYLLIGDHQEKGITPEGVHYEILKVKTFSKNRYLNFVLKNLDPDNNYKKLYKKASVLEADIYHFHDLWINKIGAKLKKLKTNPVVFYDAREPYAEDYISYSNAKGIFKIIIHLFAWWVNTWEKKCAAKYDLVLSNEPTVRDKFRKSLGNEKAEVLYNFTDIYRDFDNTTPEQKQYDFIYCGAITRLRGAFMILEATRLAKYKIPDIKVVMVGAYSPPELKAEMELFLGEHKLENNVFLFPRVDYTKVSEFYNNSKAGLVTLLPVLTYQISMPIKVFEYMAFGLPIVGSNFGKIKEYVEENDCGILVDPEDASQIAEAMITVLTDGTRYERYSENGRKVTLEKYRWDLEFERLLAYYTKFLNEL